VEHSTEADTVTTQLLKMVEEDVLEATVRAGVATYTVV